MTHRVPRVIAAFTAALLVALAIASGCSQGRKPVEKSPETLAVEETAGDFLDYYEEVLQLSRRHANQPDSFRVALEALPGSHLSQEEWDAWTAPYREDPGRLADHLEKVIANLATVK
jgi:hypothetical protein